MAFAFRALLVGCAAFFMSGCSEVNYERTKPGKLQGKLILEWIDQDKFRFISDNTKPLRFVRANSEVIQPGAMFTDGGSIPAPLRAIKSFSPWGYAPAFIIHDWLFVMKQCRLKGFEKWDHLKAAEVFSEVMKTIMENPKFGGPNKLVHYSMYEGVRTQVAKDYWDNGKCETPGGRTRSIGMDASRAPGTAEPNKESAPTSGSTRSLSTRPLARSIAGPTTRMRTVIDFD
jgi:Protein of unknown function (DUF1353)